MRYKSQYLCIYDLKFKSETINFVANGDEIFYGDELNDELLEVDHWLTVQEIEVLNAKSSMADML